ncbi:MAG TPA: head-tail connector protein [Rhizomicrobium sp.]|nr:head-tail connector protein [Rhizomicrobium sp.]
MPLELVTPPAAEPVTLSDAKLHLKVDTGDDDALITSLIAAARARAEWHTGRAFITQSWRLWLDGWPGARGDGGLPPALSATPPVPISIPLPPLASVDSITTYAMDDSATVMDTSMYQADTASAPGRIALKVGVAPPVNLRSLNAIAIAFTAGYGASASDVPDAILRAILMIVADLYANRGDAGVETSAAALATLAPYRILNL